MIVIEHNLSVIAEADYVVDIGPEAGALGGEIVAAGTPEEVAKNRLSRTAPFLREVLAQGRECEQAPAKRDSLSRCAAKRRSRAAGSSAIPGLPRLRNLAETRAPRCSPTSCTISIRSFSTSGETSDRAGTAWPTSWLLPAVTGSSRLLAKRGYTELRAGAGRRLHHLGRALRRHARRPARLRSVLPAGNAARSALDLAQSGKAECRATAACSALIVFTFYYSWRHKISWTNLGDNLVVVAPIGLFFGRCANFINGELYGRLTNVPWAMLFPKELLEPRNARRSRSRPRRRAAGRSPA